MDQAKPEAERSHTSSRVSGSGSNITRGSTNACLLLEVNRIAWLLVPFSHPGHQIQLRVPNSWFMKLDHLHYQPNCQIWKKKKNTFSQTCTRFGAVILTHLSLTEAATSILQWFTEVGEKSRCLLPINLMELKVSSYISYAKFGFWGPTKANVPPAGSV